MTKTLLTTLKENIEVIDTPEMLFGMYKGILTRDDLNPRQKKYLEIKVLKRANEIYYGEKSDKNENKDRII